ncbi:hypothetical protein F4680DRAFT_426251 [Xylaria scruposa]|nr:hypothetical protein F4680DRAFT_426251 [Xylaria scruposa]
MPFHPSTMDFASFEKENRPFVNESAEEIYLDTIIKSHQDVYETYSFAADQNMLGDLRPFWDERTEFEEFLAEPRPNGPHLCVLSVEDERTATLAYRMDRTARVTYRLAAHQISLQRKSLRNEAHYPVIFIAPQCQPYNFRDYWQRLVRDAVEKLRPLAGGALLTVSERDSTDTCLEAIERIEQLASPKQPIRHICFVAGLDTAYDKTIGCEFTYDYHLKTETDEGCAALEVEYSRLTREDVAQREKVVRLVRALVRLFGNGRFGKLVFSVSSEFADHMKALVGGTPHEEFTYWEPRRMTPVVSPYFAPRGAGGNLTINLRSTW